MTVVFVQNGSQHGLLKVPFLFMNDHILSEYSYSVITRLGLIYWSLLYNGNIKIFLSTL